MQEVLWIIDGNNLICGDPQLSTLRREGGWAAACAFLESQLGLFHARMGRGHSVALVYDGAPPPGQRSHEHKGFRVLRCASGEEADAVVLREARREEGKRAVRVVTSDRHDIANRLRGLRVEWYSVKEFRSLLWPQGEGGASRGASEKPQRPRGKEVDYWMDVFGGESKRE